MTQTFHSDDLQKALSRATHRRGRQKTIEFLLDDPMPCETSPEEAERRNREKRKREEKRDRQKQLAKQSKKRNRK